MVGARKVSMAWYIHTAESQIVLLMRHTNFVCMVHPCSLLSLSLAQCVCVCVPNWRKLWPSMKSVLVYFFFFFGVFFFHSFSLGHTHCPVSHSLGHSVSIPLENMDLLMRRRQYGEARSSRRNKQTKREIRHLFGKLLVLCVCVLSL